MPNTIETTAEFVSGVYRNLERNLSVIRKRLDRPLTLTEKILFGHLDNPQTQALERGKSHLLLRPDRIAMQDATAQMAILQFMQAELPEVAVRTTVHCDHLIQASMGAKSDMNTALLENQEVYDFLESASAKLGIGFWKPGAGIIHQVVLENYAFPGGLMIGTDSHTPNAGGLCMIAIGVGGADAVDVMSGLAWELLCPNIIGVNLKGKLSGWTSSKDVILRVCEILTTKGGTNAVIEYFGEGTSSISGTGKGTITNMGAELGATTSIFPYDDRARKFLEATDREKLAQLAKESETYLTADPEVLNNPENYFDKVIEIDLSSLEPHVVGPHSPDVARPVSQLAHEVKEKGYPDNIRYALIGSCTNSSYEDIGRAAHIARQAGEAGLKVKIPLMVTPGSEKIYQTIKRDGLLDLLEGVGATVLANACGPCIGQWKREDIEKGEKNTILTSYNRNFRGRNDGNTETMAFIGSPELVTAFSFFGKLSVNPLKETLYIEGNKFQFKEPQAPELPPKGFEEGREGYIPPPKDPQTVKVVVKKESERLSLLSPFPPWDGKDFEGLPVLIKALGKCTTDHISPAGPWLRYRGHLDKISDNMFLFATNSFTGEQGTGIHFKNGEKKNLSKLARQYKEENYRWVAIGDENYGEGSSREHAAMTPRFLGCAVVITKSFARIHETNLKKQGILPLTFENPSDYEKIGEKDLITLYNLNSLSPGANVLCVIRHADGSEETIFLLHSFNEEQIKWFHAGSSLNAIKDARAKEKNKDLA